MGSNKEKRHFKEAGLQTFVMFALKTQHTSSKSQDTLHYGISIDKQRDI